MEVSVKCFGVETTWAHPLCKLQATKSKCLSNICIAGTVETEETGRKDLHKGSRVVGLLEPIFDYDKSVISKTAVNPYFFVEIPPEVNPTDAAASLLPALRSYSALGSFTPLRKDDVCLILCVDDVNQIVIAQQICQIFGAKPLVWCSSDKIKEQIRSQCDSLADLISLDFYSLSNLAAVCLEKTSGKGVDRIIEFGARCPSEDSSTPSIPACDILPCLAVGGLWVTSQIGLQLTCQEFNLLLLKGGTLSCLFESTWLLSPLKTGNFLQILSDIMMKLKDKLIRPHVELVIDCAQFRDGRICETTKGTGATIFKL